MTGKVLKELRRRLGFTQSDFGAWLGFSRQHIEKMENGRYRVSRRLILELHSKNAFSKKEKDTIYVAKEDA